MTCSLFNANNFHYAWHMRGRRIAFKETLPKVLLSGISLSLIRRSNFCPCGAVDADPKAVPLPSPKSKKSKKTKEVISIAEEKAAELSSLLTELVNVEAEQREQVALYAVTFILTFREHQARELITLEQCDAAGHLYFASGCTGSGLKRFREAAKTVLLRMLKNKDKFRNVVREVLKGPSGGFLLSLREEYYDISSQFDEELKKKQILHQLELEERLLQKRLKKLQNSEISSLLDSESKRNRLLQQQELEEKLLQLRHKKLHDQYLVDSAFADQKTKDAKNEQDKAYQEKLTKKKGLTEEKEWKRVIAAEKRIAEEKAAEFSYLLTELIKVEEEQREQEAFYPVVFMLTVGELHARELITMEQCDAAGHLYFASGCTGSSLKRFRWAAKKVLLQILRNKDKFRDVVREVLKGQSGAFMHSLRAEADEIAERFETELKRNQILHQHALDEKLLHKRRKKLRAATRFVKEFASNPDGGGGFSLPTLTPKQKLRRALVRAGILRDRGQTRIGNLATVILTEDKLHKSYKAQETQRLHQQYVVNSALAEQKTKDAKKQQDKAFQEKLKKKKHVHQMKNMLNASQSFTLDTLQSNGSDLIRSMTMDLEDC